MSELRKDPIVERWVVMAPERARRPIAVQDEPHLTLFGIDPFAEGSEAETADELFAFRTPDSQPNGPGWRVRVVPNKYPAVHFSGGELETLSDGLYVGMNGVGTHEVIIECPHAEPNIGRLPAGSVTEVLAAYRGRLVDLKRDSRLAHALIFKNQGSLAGASVHHSHSQLIATPFVPISIVEEISGALEYYRQTGRNIFDVMVQHELAAGARIVFATSQFVAFCPYASRFAYETWIVPRKPESHFEQIDPAELAELGFVLKTVLRKLDLGLDNPALNYVIHSAPFRTADLAHYRWHIEILPRLTRIAGFEWGSGCYVNEVLPERAAQVLREVLVG